MKFLFRCFFIFLITTQSFYASAQDTLLHCGTDRVMKSVYLNSQKAIDNHQLLEQFTQQFQQAGSTRQLYVIPVVFHIIHNYGSENISDWQVNDAMKILNEDFNKTNSDTSAIVNQFKPIAAYCDIEFRLATIDPNGSCTNGIDHIVSTTTYSAGEHSKLNPWPNDKYLNIWVVHDIGIGAAGYAYYPGSADPDKDGIVILSNYLGSVGTGDYARARALTHEVGHWLNLKHTWGDTNNAGELCGDDDVNDTPETKGWSTCILNGAVCSPAIENVQNYMEYAYCSCMFSWGQKTRMLAALNSNLSGRNNLWSSLNLIATGTDLPASSITYCIPVADFISSSRYACSGQSINLIDKSWNAKVLYRFWNVSGANASSLSDSVITISFNNPGWYSISLLAGNNEGSDFKIKTDLIQILPDTAMFSNGYIESFESGEMPSNNFIPDNNDFFHWYLNNNVGYSGTRCLAFNNFKALNGRTYSITGPTFNISNLSNPILTFHLAYAQTAAGNNDRLRILVSENCGLSWTTRYIKTGPQLATAPYHVLPFSPDPSEWRMETVNLNANASSTDLRIKFEFMNDDGNNIFIDDINIGGYSFADELNGENEFEIFPNPVLDHADLKFNLKNNGTGRIILTDVYGRMLKEIYSGEINKYATFTINFVALPPAVYFIQLEIADQKTIYRFVKL